MAQFWEQSYCRRCCKEESPTILIMFAVQVDAAFCIYAALLTDIRRTKTIVIHIRELSTSYPVRTHW